MTIRESLEALLADALAAAVASGALALDAIPEPTLERPKDESHGDWACTIAMRLAKQAHMNPRAIAQIVVDSIPENQLIESSEIAGPGFINFRLAPSAFQNVVAKVRSQGADYGKSSLPEPVRVDLEYVSANPTGPMHVGHGRWAALGDATARILRHAGYQVDEEFYINDQGNQMNVFGNSVVVRYQQLLGLDVEMPEASYGGGYVKDIAQAIIDQDGDKWLEADEAERLVNFRERGYAMMLDSIKGTLSTFGNSFDTWFSERSLFVPGEDGRNKVQIAFDVMKEKGHIYEKDGATYFRSTTFGDDKDRVLIKQNGELTYFMSDVAYHYDKMQRGYDLLIDIWGADHHGYIPRCQAMMAAWGYPGALEVMLGQLVNLLRGGKPVRMSKRTGEMVTFQELIDEVGVDATRYLMLSKSSDQAIDFDIEEAKKQDSSNPVYYVQYAHARICSIIRKAAGAEGDTDELTRQLDLDAADLSLLTDASELALMKEMSGFTDLIAAAARDRAAFRLTHYAQALAGLFHRFYTDCRVIGDDTELTRARLALCDAARKNLALTLSLLGVSAPERM
jgi:arginyl-tRNA synthetase